jgi:DNA-binding MarR family transcriptional regulator
MAAPYYTLDSLQPSNSIGYLVKRCGILAMQIAERGFESQPITFTQWVVLAQLSQHAYLTPSELSKHLGHDMGALTRIVDDLHEKQLVRRERSEEDRRAVRITITAAGRRLATTTKSVVLGLANDHVAIYTKAETDLLISLLQRMLAHMESVAEQPPEDVAIGARPTVGRRRK